MRLLFQAAHLPSFHTRHTQERNNCCSRCSRRGCRLCQMHPTLDHAPRPGEFAKLVDVAKKKFARGDLFEAAPRLSHIPVLAYCFFRSNMSVCVYIHICSLHVVIRACVQVSVPYVCTHVYISMHVCMCACAHVRLCACAPARMRACAHARLCACLYVCMCACPCAYVRRCEHACMHACMQEKKGARRGAK